MNPTLAKLIAELSDADAQNRAAAADAIGVFGAEAAPAVGALTTALADSNEAVSLAAARTLGAIGPAAQAAIAALSDLVDSGTGAIGGAAANAIQKITGGQAVSSTTPSGKFNAFDQGKRTMRLTPEQSEELAKLLKKKPEGAS